MMAGDAFRKVRSGEPLAIPAEAYNAFVDAARANREGRGGVGDTIRSVRQAGVVGVLNATGEPRARFDVVGIDGPVLDPADHEDAFAERVALRGVVPAATHAGRFAVLLAPALEDTIAPAVVSGVVVARVRVADECDRYAEVEPPNTGRLRTVPSGSAGILWLQPPADRDDPEIAWAVLRLGPGSPLVVGVITAASASTPTPAASVNYDGEAAGLPFSGQTPLLRPFDGLPVIEPAGVGDACLVLIDSDGSCGPIATLLSVGERLVHEECEETPEEPAFRVGDGLSSSSDWVIGANLKPVVTRTGHLGVLAAPGADRAVALTRTGDVAVGASLAPVVIETHDFAAAVEPGYFDDVPITVSVAVAVGAGVAPGRTVAAGPPIGGL